MPVDFLRVPPRVDVPVVSRPSIVGWALLLCLLLAGGAAVAVFVWPRGKPDNGLFWFVAIELPILAWGFLLSCRFAYLHGCVNAALAINRTDAAIEAQCHEASSQPLVALGHAWRFGCSDDENSLDALVSGKTTLRPVASQAEPDTDVIARWLDVPGRQFYAGNVLNEYARQTALCEWLLNELVLGITPQLLELPAGGTVYVDLCIDSLLSPQTVAGHLLSLVKETARTSRVRMSPPTSELTLFHADSWFDKMAEDTTRLLVAIQLRNSASEVLARGVAEAASMVLVSSVPLARKIGETSPVYIHRPAKGAPENVAETVGLAVRWGRTAFGRIETNWRVGLAANVARMVRSSCDFGAATKTIDLDATVGNAGAASAWLAVALAIANATVTNGPQLVIAQERHDVLALLCGKQT